jgi:transposase
MTKYSSELKLQAVLCVLDKGCSKGAVAKQFGVAHGDIQKWVDAYEVHGIEGLTKKRFTYTGDFKQHVIEYMYANGLSARNTAATFNIAEHGSVLKWERIYYEEGPEALYRENRGRSRKMKKDKIQKPKMDKHVEEDLLAEVQRLRMENEYLKKLNALVQEREKSAKKTK